ncbi:Light-harvesting complex-like protein ohp2, chloroplastic [Sarracenia purpurea var. burkii]
MSVASSSIPCIKFSTSSSSSSSSCSSAPSPSSSTFRFSATKAAIVTIRSSQTDGPLRRPVAPASPTLKPVPLTPPKPLSSPTAASPPAAPPKPASISVAGVEGKSVVTLEFQRQKAKELQEYFKKKKLEEADQGPFFGFIGKNEIANGRWAMFGFAVGMLTEYATGSDFVDQVKILLSNFGILDLE